MKKNTVLLDIEKYNRLRDFKEKIINGKVLVEHDPYGNLTIKYYTNDDVAKEIHEINNILRRRNELLKSRIDDLRKKSVWQFLKWKRKRF
jgi:hypothetical protein